MLRATKKEPKKKIERDKQIIFEQRAEYGKRQIKQEKVALETRGGVFVRRDCVGPIFISHPVRMHICGFNILSF